MWLSWLGCLEVEPSEPEPPAPQIVDVSGAPGRLSSDLEITVSLTLPAQVAVLCAAPGDASEHLAESDQAATQHTLRLQGLLPETSYTCRAAPTEPEGNEPPSELGVQTGPAPGLPTLTAEEDPVLGMTGYWTLVSYLDGACSWSDHGWLVLYDAQGAARWWYELPASSWIDVEALYHPDLNRIVWGGGLENELGRPRFVDLWAGDTYITAFPAWQTTRFSHDAKLLADGRVLTLDYRTFTDGEQEWLGVGVRLHEPETDSIVYDWDGQALVEEGWLGLPWSEEEPDRYHANWVDWIEHPQGPRIYVSLCKDRSILSIDADSGALRYKLARGLGWTVLDEAGQELPEDELPQCQHGLELVGDDVLLVYDNGASRDYSQIVELAVDPETLTVQRLWQWTEPGWHETTLGDVDVLGEGRVLVTEAHPECWTSAPGDLSAIVEVDRATGRVAHRLTFPEIEDTIYRSERYDGCALMNSTLACPARAARREELATRIGL